jgi:hypothetical protein
MLSLQTFQAGLTPRVLVLGYRNIADDEITRRLAEVQVTFVDYWIERLIERLDASDEAKRQATRPAIDLMAERGWFTASQLERIDAELPRPEVEAVETNAVETPALPSSSDDVTSQLERLARLHASGALSSDEFAAAKAKLLN